MERGGPAGRYAVVTSPSNLEPWRGVIKRLKPGDVVIVNFPGASGIKRRLAVVLSTDIYHTHRPDVIVDLLTTNIEAATAPTDYVLKDWEAAGLHFPSAFRSYILTLDDGTLPSIGHLSDCDWQEVQASLKLALAMP